MVHSEARLQLFLSGWQLVLGVPVDSRTTTLNVLRRVVNWTRPDLLSPFVFGRPGVERAQGRASSKGEDDRATTLQ